MDIEDVPSNLRNIKQKLIEEEGITLEEYEKKVEVIYIQGPNSLDNLLTAI